MTIQKAISPESGCICGLKSRLMKRAKGAPVCLDQTSRLVDCGPTKMALSLIYQALGI
jgi:hypothetical protein